VGAAELRTLVYESKRAERRELSGDARIIALIPSRTLRIASPWAVSALRPHFGRLLPPPSPEAQRFGHLEGRWKFDGEYVIHSTGRYSGTQTWEWFPGGLSLVAKAE
jgi:hypothetical protein